MSLTSPFNTGMPRTLPPLKKSIIPSNKRHPGAFKPVPALRDGVFITSQQGEPGHPARPPKKAVRIQDIFRRDEHSTLKYVLRHPKRDLIFKIDRSRYPQVLSNEQVATKNPNADMLIIRNGFHQILFSAPVLKDENGPVWVRLKGPVIWPNAAIDEGTMDEKDTNTPPKPYNTTATDRPWRQALRNIFKDSPQPQISKPTEPLMMDIVVRFSDLSPEGSTDELELIPTESLPTLWKQKRLIFPEE